MPYAQVKDLQLYYETQGTGEPLLLIPGFATGLWTWFKQVPALAEQFRVIAYDPRGVGRSDKPEQPFNMRTLADDIAGLLEALNIKEAHVLGTSFGGFVAQEFALAYPRLTRSLVLCCTSFGGARHLLPAQSTLAAFATSEGVNSEARARKNLALAFSPEYLAENGAEFETVIDQRLRNPVAEAAFIQQLQAAATFDAADRVDDITAPTLIVTGDGDAVVPAENSRNLAAAIPRAQLLIIEAGSHMFFIERAAEFNRAVVAFIKQSSEQGKA